MVSIIFLWVASKVKKDDAKGLAALLDNLEETESWEDRTAASCDRSETYIDTITWCVYIYVYMINRSWNLNGRTAEESREFTKRI